MEKSHYADIENQMLDLLDRVGEPDLSGARNNLEGRFHITDWTTNPNFLAAYSAMLPGVIAGASSARCCEVSDGCIQSGREFSRTSSVLA